MASTRTESAKHAKQFKNSTNLKYLNTLLKLNDVICSQITSIDNSIDASLFNIVISHELNFITTLIQKKIALKVILSQR